MQSTATQEELDRTAGRGQRDSEVSVSVVIPCLNEAENITECVTRARAVLDEHGIAGEVVVADNGSADGSAELAEAAGARVVHEARRGYGSAYLAGFSAARGDHIVMADADLTYDFSEIPRFVTHLRDGADMVIGDRMQNIQPGAMPWHHRYIGNPMLTGILNLFFRTGVRDAHCGMRGIRREVLPRLDLRSTGMEFASEMVIRASKEKLVIHDIPIEYHPRGGESKLSSFRDGWRHLRFLLVHSPTWLFLVPGGVMLALGLLVTVLVALDVSFFGREWNLHAMVGAAMLTIVGSQIVNLGLGARAYGVYHLNERPDRLFTWGEQHMRLESGLLFGGLLFVVGLVIAGIIVGTWIDRGFGQLSEERLMVLGAVLVIVGLQTVFSAFFLSILGSRREDRR